MKIQLLQLSFISILLLLFGCSPTISTFDQIAYVQVTSLKVDALNLMNEGIDSYSQHSVEIKELQLKIDKAIEYDLHRPKNEITNKMWSLLNDPAYRLFGGFLVEWKKEGKCGSAYIMEKKKQVAKSFDQIAELESKKIKPSQVSQ
jgi:hypothetical protein